MESQILRRLIFRKFILSFWVNWEGPCRWMTVRIEPKYEDDSATDVYRPQLTTSALWKGIQFAYYLFISLGMTTVWIGDWNLSMSCRWSWHHKKVCINTDRSMQSSGQLPPPSFRLFSLPMPCTLLLNYPHNFQPGTLSHSDTHTHRYYYALYSMLQSRAAPHNPKAHGMSFICLVVTYAAETQNFGTKEVSMSETLEKKLLCLDPRR